MVHTGYLPTKIERRVHETNRMRHESYRKTAAKWHKARTQLTPTVPPPGVRSLEAAAVWHAMCIPHTAPAAGRDSLPDAQLAGSRARGVIAPKRSSHVAAAGRIPDYSVRVGGNLVADECIRGRGTKRKRGGVIASVASSLLAACWDAWQGAGLQLSRWHGGCCTAAGTARRCPRCSITSTSFRCHQTRWQGYQQGV